MKHLKFIFIIILLNWSCNNSAIQLLSVDGKIKHYAHKKITLITFENSKTPIILDSTTTDHKGRFNLQTIYQPNELLAIKTEDGLPYWIVSDAQNIEVTLHANNYKSYTVQGSKASEQLHEFVNKLDKLVNEKINKQILVDSLSKQLISDSLLSIQKNELKNLQWNLKQFCKLSIAKTNNPALKYFYMFYGLQTHALDEKVVYKQLAVLCDSFPKHKQLESLKNSLSIAVKSDPKLFLVDSKAPVFSILDSSKKAISFTNFNGKFLLLNFWSSSNIAQRNQLKQLNEIYSIYKDKNFDILSISVDTSKQNWLYQIKKDSIVWKNVIDTLGFKSKLAKDYYISTTPYNILIHPNKNIIAVDIKTDQLKDKLKELIP